MSFYCEECEFENTEVQSAGEIQEHGTKYSLRVDRLDDMEREVVKSDTAVLRLEDLELEIPAGRGQYTQIEGIVMEVLKDLQHDQYKRQREDPDLFRKLDMIIQPLVKISVGEGYPFTITLDDPAGNSWIAPSRQDESKKKFSRTEYSRTPEQNASLGLGVSSTNEHQGLVQIENNAGEIVGEVDSMDGVDIKEGLQYSFPLPCPGCTKSAVMNMQMVNIPHFKQVVISAVTCSQCGYKTSDVKTGGEIPDKGRRIWLEVKSPIDLHRDILKSETCLLRVAACNVEVIPGFMGGRFTTVEGVLTQIRDDLRSSVFGTDDVDGTKNDSMVSENREKWKKFFDKLGKAIECKFSFTILLEDPLASSYVQSLHAPDPDPNIKTEDYERTAEEEEELGLADMKTQMATNGEYVKETKEVTDPSEEDQESKGAAQRTGVDNEVKSTPKANKKEEGFKEASQAGEKDEEIEDAVRAAQVTEKVTEPVEAEKGHLNPQKVANALGEEDLEDSVTGTKVDGKSNKDSPKKKSSKKLQFAF